MRARVLGMLVTVVLVGALPTVAPAKFTAIRGAVAGSYAYIEYPVSGYPQGCAESAHLRLAGQFPVGGRIWRGVADTPGGMSVDCPGGTAFRQFALGGAAPGGSRLDATCSGPRTVHRFATPPSLFARLTCAARISGGSMSPGVGHLTIVVRARMIENPTDNLVRDTECEILGCGDPSGSVFSASAIGTFEGG